MLYYRPVIADKIIYTDNANYRVLNLRLDGVDEIPVLGYSNFSSVRAGPDFHFHPNCIEFCYCVKGNLIFDTRDREYAFRPGHVFVSRPDEPHHLRTNPSGLIIYRILFQVPRGEGCVLGLDKRGSEWLVRSLLHLPSRLFRADEAVKRAFDELFAIYDGVSRKSPVRRVKMRVAVLNLLLAMVESARRLPQLPSSQITELTKRIKQRPEEDYRSAEIAQEFGISHSTFTQLFKSSTGLPFHAYLVNARVEHAKYLLTHTRRPITVIANELGFCSAQHFARMFRRIIGASPQVYRTMGRK